MSGRDQRPFWEELLISSSHPPNSLIFSRDFSVHSLSLQGPTVSAPLQSPLCSPDLSRPSRPTLPPRGDHCTVEGHTPRPLPVSHLGTPRVPPLLLYLICLHLTRHALLGSHRLPEPLPREPRCRPSRVGPLAARQVLPAGLEAAQWQNEHVLYWHFPA